MELGRAWCIEAVLFGGLERDSRISTLYRKVVLLALKPYDILHFSFTFGVGVNQFKAV